MRCHPDRAWRGIVPPPYQDKERRAFPDADDTEVDIAEYLLVLQRGQSEMEEPSASARRFECSCCHTQFGTPQSLGGHRAKKLECGQEPDSDGGSRS
ncbi:Zinc finger protein ZAT3 [Acorus calamus]|uniref:Zinc finger protein ZAT3 n=1 Tax=Acorus calamus TaxID=4465 RepID=A0AAV9CH45_ACOCL|nr:Zinc finger protein ZAT3 [Acorus calamus]